MSKLIVFSATLVLLAGSGAWACTIGVIDQGQNAYIGLASNIQLFGGHQTTGSIQNLAVAKDQAATRVGAAATQSLVGHFAQIGSASANHAVVGVLQGLTASGEQGQLVKTGYSPKVQGQSLDLLAEQGLSRMGGAGAGNALQQIVMKEEQRAVNPMGIMEESSVVLGLQVSDLTGSGCGAGAVNNSMSVNSAQSQATW
jgi:hypothetical protein